jgi:hypothetical protein
VSEYANWLLKLKSLVKIVLNFLELAIAHYKMLVKIVNLLAFYR